MSEVRNLSESYQMGEVLKASSRITVYRASDPATGQAVVVKVLIPAGGSGIHVQHTQFMRVMGVIKALEPRGVPALIDCGVDDSGNAFIVMEHIDGMLLSVCTDWSSDRLLRTLAAVAEILEALARDGIFHHNLDPDNILVGPGDAGDDVSLLGFGSAAFRETDDGPDAVRETPESDRYIAPERRIVDPGVSADDWRSDLYSFALIAVDMLGAEIDDQDGAEPGVRFPVSVRGGLVQPGNLENVLGLALRRDPGQRHLDWVDLRDALHAAKAGEPIYQEAATLPAEEIQRAGGGQARSSSPVPESPQSEAEVTAYGETVTLPLEELDWSSFEQTMSSPALPESLLRETEPLPEPPPLPRPESASPPVEPPPIPEPTPPEPPPVPPPTPPSSEAAAAESEPASPSSPEPPPLPPPLPPDPAAGPEQHLGGVARPVAPPRVPTSDPKIEPSPSTMSKRRLAIGVGGVTAVVIVILALVALWPEPPETTASVDIPPAAVPTRVPTPRAVPTRAPVMTVDPRLEAADIALMDGDSELARSELEALSREEIDSFTAEEKALYDELMMALDGGDLEEALGDLRGGLAAGSVKMLRRAVTTLSDLEDDEIAAEPGLAEDLERARTALHLRTLMFRARESDDSAQLLERATAMIEALPKYSTAVEYRDQAAASLDREAEAAADEGNYDRAITSLEAIVAFWPDREGVVDRLADYRRQQRDSLADQQARADFDDLLTTALARGEAGAPDDGLRMIATGAAPAGMDQRRREVVAALESRLAELDVSPPQIELGPDTELVYRKNNPAQIVCRITDDYRVVEAVAMLRAEGSPEFHEVPFSAPDGDLYTIEIGRDVHQNKAVEIYIEAVDASGRIGRLGSAEEPLRLKRRKGLFKRILKK